MPGRSGRGRGKRPRRPQGTKEEAMRRMLVLGLVGMLCVQRLWAEEGDPVRVVPVGEIGAAVGVDLGRGSRVPAFIRNHWGKLLTGILTVVTVDRVAQHNDWLWYDRGDDAADTARSGAADAATPSGNGNVTVRVTASDSANVRIAIYTDDTRTRTDHSENVSNYQEPQ